MDEFYSILKTTLDRDFKEKKRKNFSILNFVEG